MRQETIWRIVIDGVEFFLPDSDRMTLLARFDSANAVCDSEVCTIHERCICSKYVVEEISKRMNCGNCPFNRKFAMCFWAIRKIVGYHDLHFVPVLTIDWDRRDDEVARSEIQKVHDALENMEVVIT